MKRLLRLAALAYPARWRQRYGDEFDALLDEMAPTVGNVADVLRGGIVTRIRAALPAILAVVFGTVGLAAALTIARVTSHQIQSTVTIAFQSATSSTADANHLDSAVLRLADRALDDAFEYQIAGDRESLDAVKDNIRILLLRERLPSSVRDPVALPLELQVSYVSNDSGRSQAVVQQLASRILDVGLDGRESGDGSVPAGTWRIMGPASSPRPSLSHQRVLTASALGLGSGAVIGLMLGFRWRNRAIGAR